MIHVRIVASCMALAMALNAGIVVKSKYTADGKTSNMTVYSSPGRQRVDLGDSRTIQQCETKRYVQVDEKTKTFIVVPPPAPVAAPTPEQAAGAGACANKPVAADTGERKQMLGFTASRWKTTLEGCDGTKTEIDGYYTGFEYAVSCELAPAFSTGAPGSPLAYNLTTTDKAGKSTSVSYVVEALELSSAPLDPSIFEVPGEAKETSVQTAQAVRNPDYMEAVAAPKPVGNRVGVATAGGKGAMDIALVKMLKDAKVDAVPLGAGTDVDIQARAEQAKADYVLMIEVGELKPGGTNKAAGFLSKASSLASGSAERQAYNATVNYTMMQLGGTTPKLAASAVGSTTQFGLKEAVALGRAASMFTPMGMMMRPGMGGMMPFLMQMGGPGMMGGGYGTGMGMGLPALMRSTDPGMMMMQPAVQAGMQSAGSLGGESQEGAVSSAMEKIAKAVATSLRPGAADAKPAGKPAKGKKK